MLSKVKRKISSDSVSVRKKKLINIFETLLADEIAHAKTSTVKEWNKAVEDHGLKIPPGLEDEVLKTLGAANGHGTIDAGEWLKYLDTILVVKSKHEDEIMSKMGMFQEDIQDKKDSWLTHLADMVELANEKAKKKKKRLMIRLNKRGLPPSFAFSISSTRFNAQDFSRAANRNLTHTLQEIGDIYPEYFHSEICQAKTREPFVSTRATPSHLVACLKRLFTLHSIIFDTFFVPKRAF